MVRAHLYVPGRRRNKTSPSGCWGKRFDVWLKAACKGLLKESTLKQSFIGQSAKAARQSQWPLALPDFW